MRQGALVWVDQKKRLWAVLGALVRLQRLTDHAGFAG